MRRRGTLKRYVAPDYAGMPNVIFHSRAENFVVGTTNSAGVVDGSGNVTKAISIITTVHEFDSNGTAPVLSGSGIDKIITFGGAGRLRHNGLSSVFNNFHFRANILDLKWTVHAVVMFNTGTNPNNVSGMFGNNGASSSSKGIHGNYDDRSASNFNNAFTFGVSRGTSNSWITLANNGNILPGGKWLDLVIQVDKSQTTDSALQTRIFIDGYEHCVSNRTDSATMVTTPTYAMEIGGCGNATVPGLISIKEITFMEGVMTDAFRRDFILARMSKYRITPKAHSLDNILLRTKVNSLINLFDETRYYLTNHLCQSPLNSDVIVSIFGDAVAHTFDADKKISTRKSTDKGRTWGSKGLVFDPGVGEGVSDLGAGYDSAGRLHLITDTHTSFSVGGTHKLYYMYSDNDGGTWSTPTDITSIVPSDGLLTWRTYTKIIENNGVLIGGFYKTTDEGDSTNSARYCLRSTNNGTTWTAILIQSGTTFRNEFDVIDLSSTVLLVVTRDDVTFEWYQSVSTDNGLNWTNQGDLSFGEVLTRAAPVRLRKLLINGTLVIACYFSDRDRDTFKVIYGTAANLISSGLTGWNLASKFVIFQGTSSQHLHYGDVCHFNNDFNAIAMYPYDAFPASGPGTSNVMYTFYTEGNPYSYVKTLLGL